MAAGRNKWSTERVLLPLPLLLPLLLLNDASDEADDTDANASSTTTPPSGAIVKAIPVVTVL
jgi:hypothetical protein